MRPVRGLTILVALIATAVSVPSTASAGVFGRASLAAPALAGTLPKGFTETTLWTGLGNPTVIRFARDGRVFVASKSGIVNVFDSLADTTPTQFVDLRSKVHDYWDRGLLGMALDPGFTTGRPYVYVLYAYDKAPDSTQQPRWGDGCPTPPGPTADGCVISGRLSRLSTSGSETVLINDWCQQYPSHSIGTLDFGPDGMLYVSAGDGASFNFADYGQDGSPVNPCGDPPGATLTPPTAQGGALRAQSFRRPATHTASLDGAILRVNPDTGAAAAGNPAIGNADPNRRRIIAHGFRNPFRFTFRPGTGELWAGDVGWDTWEEIDRVPDASQVRNYGWPCYEGVGRMGAYDSLNLENCETLYAQGTGAVVGPYYTYNHSEKVVPGETCTTGSSSVSGLAFYTADAFPAAYKNALFFSDYSRNCIWVMYLGTNGLPDPATRQTFLAGAAGPVFLTQGPDGALYYADLAGGTVRRVAADNNTPTARITATPSSGAAPLTVAFDGTKSSDPEGQALTYAWDLDGDGAYDDSTASKPSFTYASAGTVTVRLRVTDTVGSQGTTSTTITVGTRPTVTVSSPTSATTWAVGDTISFSGSARNSAGATLPASALRWGLDMRHCSPSDATSCHTHHIQDYVGVAAGSLVAPDHEFPSHLELSLTATDAAGLTATQTIRLNPRTTDVTLASVPPGLELAFGSEALPAPFTRTVLARSAIWLNAPSPQGLSTWSSWSDGGARLHTTNAPDGGVVTYTASFLSPPAGIPPAGIPPAGIPPAGIPPVCVCAPPRPVAAWGFDEPSGRTVPGGKLAGPLRVRGGKFGNALDFDGVDDWVTVKAPTLGRTMTVEAWVYPTRRGGSLALRETKRGAAWSLYGDEAGIGTRFARGAAPKLRRWTHLAMTYDGVTIRRYVDGKLAGTRAPAGTIAGGAYPLRFGGNAVWKEWFKGRLDEVRVYDSALTPAQIQADMSTPIDAEAKAAVKRKRVKGGAKVRKYRGASRAHR